MKKNLLIKEFNSYTSNNADAANEFLKGIGSRVVSVTPIYSQIFGGIRYVVVYWSN